MSDINLKMKRPVDKNDDSIESDVSDERNGPEVINNISSKQNTGQQLQQPKLQPRQGQSAQAKITVNPGTQFTPIFSPPEGQGIDASKLIPVKAAEVSASANKYIIPEEKKVSDQSNPSSQESAASTEAKRILPPENTNKNMPSNIAPVGKSGPHRGEDDIVEDSADFDDDSMSDVSGDGEDDEVDGSDEDDDDDGSEEDDDQSVPSKRNR